VMVAMINRAEEQRNMKLGQAKHQQKPRFNRSKGAQGSAQATTPHRGPLAP
jgi:hypothetical protein